MDAGCDLRVSGASGRTSDARSFRGFPRASLRFGRAPGSTSNRLVSLDAMTETGS